MQILSFCFQVDITDALRRRLAGERGLDVQENRIILCQGWSGCGRVLGAGQLLLLYSQLRRYPANTTPVPGFCCVQSRSHFASPFPPSSTDAAPACRVPHADAGGGRVHHCKGVVDVDNVGDMDNVGIVMGECLPACPSLPLLREEGLELPRRLPAGYLLCCIDAPPPLPPPPFSSLIPQRAQLSSAISAMFAQAPARIVQVRHPRQWLVEGVGKGVGCGRCRMLSVPFQATRCSLFAEGRAGPAHSLLCFLPFPSTSFSYSLTL